MDSSLVCLLRDGFPFVLWCAVMASAQDAAPVSIPAQSGTPFRLSASFSETMVTIQWPQLHGVEAYDVFADYGVGFKKVNPVPVASRSQFSFLWVDEQGRKKRVVKGNRVRLYAAAIDSEACGDERTPCRYVRLSDTVATRYFEGFAMVESRERCSALLRPSQSSARILPEVKGIGRLAFVDAFPALSSCIADIYRREVDPHDEGACVPFSSIVAVYFSRKNIPCYRAQGLFISQFHSFNIIIVDNVEYILDFTADQFLPSSSPVFIPRDCCYIDSSGVPSCKPAGAVTAMYKIDKVYGADQLRFSDTPRAIHYRRILDSLLVY